jgi:putative membrane protein
MKKSSFFMIFVIAVLSLLVYYFLGVRYELNFISKAIMSLIAFALFLYSYKRGAYQFILCISSSVLIFISLCISFGDIFKTDSPFASSIVLGPWAIFLISLFSGLAIFYIYEKIKYKDKFPLMLLILFIIVWVILAFNTKYYADWKMENWLTVPFVILILIFYRWFKLSNLSYTLIFLFMVLHIIGSHYTYAEVPLGVWMQGFFGLTRNHYDRIVHFAFGLLFAYPMREVFKRIGQSKGIWSLWIPIELVLALSCIYELMEWGVAVIFGGDLGVAYLGSQGDIWDAQKDMLNAGIGALAAMITTSFFIIYYNSKGFWSEIRDSLSIKDKEPLGEVALAKLAGK